MALRGVLYDQEEKNPTLVNGWVHQYVGTSCKRMVAALQLHSGVP